MPPVVALLTQYGKPCNDVSPKKHGSRYYEIQTVTAGRKREA